MIDLDIKIDARDFDKLERKFKAMPNEMMKAAVMGINKTATKAKTEAKRAIASEFVIKGKDIAPRIQILRANAKEIRAEITPYGRMQRGRSLHLSNFIIGNKERYLRKKGVRPDKQKAIKVRVKRGGAAKTVRGAFLIRGKNSGKLIMMQRLGKERYPIKALRTIDVPSMFGSKKVLRRIVGHVRKELPVEIERALKHVIGKRG